MNKLMLVLTALLSFNVFAEYDLEKVRRALKARMHNTDINCEESYSNTGTDYSDMNTWHKQFLINEIGDNYTMEVVEEIELEEKTIVKFISSNHIYSFYLSDSLNHVVSLKYEWFIPNSREIVEGNILDAEFRTIVDKTYRLRVNCSVKGGSYSVSEL